MLNKINSFLKIKSVRTSDFVINTFLNFIYVGLKLALNLLIFPLLFHILGKEKFGIWQTFLTIITFVAVLNFGYGNSLRNFISKKLINNSKNEIENLIGATFIKVSKITLILLVVIIPAIYFFFEPNVLFYNNHIAKNEIVLSLIIFIFTSLLNNILGIADSIAFGFHKSSLSNFFQTINILCTYSIILILSKFYRLNLIHISLIFGLTQNIMYLIFILYQRHKFQIKFVLKTNYKLVESKKLSMHFFLAQLLGLLFISIDIFIISSKLGAEETASYAVVSKIYFTLIMMFSILLIQFWNSVTDAFEKKELMWIFKILKRLYIISVLFFIIGTIIAIFNKEVMNLWFGKNTLNISAATFYLFSIYTLLHCLNSIFVNLQNGLGELKIQIYTTFFLLIIYILSVYLIDLNYYGYNILLIIKIIITAISVFINSLIVRKLKHDSIS